MSDRTTTRRASGGDPGAPRHLPRDRQSGPVTASPWHGLREKWRRLLDSPQLDYKVIMLVTGILVVLGLIVSLSSSMVSARGDAGDGSVFSQFRRQALIVLIGLVVMWGALWVRPARIRAWAPGLLFVAVGLLLLVLVIGVGDDIGSRSWIALGPLSFQPSEIAKLALSVWGAAAVAVHSRRSRDIKDGLGPFILVSGAILVLVYLQHDLGMMLSLALVFLSLLVFSGVAGRVIGVAAGVIAVIGALAITAMSYRSDRISTWFNALRLDFDDEAGQAAAFQARQGLYSLSDGGLLGVGPGQSRAKWNYLPEATNDFVFAIIGEELGIIGAGAVVVLFAILGWFGIRTASKQTDPFLRLLAATLTAGIVGQAFYNIGYVCGLLPVTGVQLPLLSAGGTSAVITLGTLGLLANCARHEPETVSSMQHEGRPWIDRVLLLREPTPYTSGAEHREQVRPQPRRYGDPVTHRASPRSGDLAERRRLPGDGRERRDTRSRDRRAGYRDTPERGDPHRSRQPRQNRTDEPRRRPRP
ncbi:FtsW/RodA/SpoVE family cell cycle protein [uncultured Corynebacterium sp.]|uniref:FtsW/RodA/SpoVE family cell cycle protein n=1 Tax=uncultured Corynebacterium sp. TaxID=159447 RepID=UPI0025E8A606|nr:putative peptidoglycan glycosyltransferase FtsW [uncultured Corynebacterium sp.]